MTQGLCEAAAGNLTVGCANDVRVGCGSHMTVGCFSTVLPSSHHLEAEAGCWCVVGYLYAL